MRTSRAYAQTGEAHGYREIRSQHISNLKYEGYKTSGGGYPLLFVNNAEAWIFRSRLYGICGMLHAFLASHAADIWLAVMLSLFHFSHEDQIYPILV